MALLFIIMSTLAQYILVGVIVAAAVLAVVRSVVKAARNEKTALSACAGCKLQDMCQKPEKNSAKKCADKVAHVKK